VAGEVSVTVDFAQGTFLALEHLMTLGHRIIAYIGPRHAHHLWESQQRLEAYRHFLNAHDLPRHPANELIITESIEEARRALRSILTHAHRPTALFVKNDSLALIVLRAALADGIRVPADLSIVGFDNIPFAALAAPALTTVHYPIEEIARSAATALLDRIEGRGSSDGPETADRTVVFAPTLVCRESTGPPRQPGDATALSRD
jgi:DNA-binding LacI/PurR family transcriptional regulator